jgi:hypothetical protein
MNKKNLWFLITIFIALDCFLLYKNKTIITSNKKIVEHTEFVKKENNSLKTVIGFFYQNEGRYIEEETCVTDDGKKVELHVVIRLSNKRLIFKYKTSDCSDCVIKIFKEIQNLKKYGQIIVIADFVSISSMRYLKQKYDLQNVLFLQSKSNNDLENTPCLFMCSSDFRIIKFLHINTNDLVLNSYLKAL